MNQHVADYIIERVERADSAVDWPFLGLVEDSKGLLPLKKEIN